MKNISEEPLQTENNQASELSVAPVENAPLAETAPASEEDAPIREMTATEEEPTAIAPPESESTALTEEELQRLLEEAEQRGWLRARNELAAQAMASPAMLGNPSLSPAANTSADGRDDFASRFLRTLTPDVWE